jgi:hypothetical protein
MATLKRLSGIDLSEYYGSENMPEVEEDEIFHYTPEESDTDYCDFAPTCSFAMGDRVVIGGAQKGRNINGLIGTVTSVAKDRGVSKPQLTMKGKFEWFGTYPPTWHCFVLVDGQGPGDSFGMKPSQLQFAPPPVVETAPGIQGIQLLIPNDNWKALYINEKKVLEGHTLDTDLVIYAVMEALGLAESTFSLVSWEDAEEDEITSDDHGNDSINGAVVWENGVGCPDLWPFEVEV